jgi:glycosyltransferase involved in cell wall biosynthesis
LAPFVSHLGRLNRQELLDEYRRSLAVLSLYRVSNLGNVSLEALACGAVLVTWDDGSVAGIVQDGISGFLAHTPVDAAERIGLLLQKPELAASIRQAAKETAAKHFSSWDSRAAREVEMIEKAVSSRGGWSK